MDYPSNLILTVQPREIQGSQGKIFKKKREIKSRIKWCPVLLLALTCVILKLIIIFSSSDCVLYINGKRNITLNQENCTSALLHSRNDTTWVQVSNEEKIDLQSNTDKLEIRKIMNTPRGVNYALEGCILVMILLIILIKIPHNPGNYRTWFRRITWCFEPSTLREAINRYMQGYISDENQYKNVVETAREGLNKIIDRLKGTIPEVTFDVLITGSIQERVGKPTIIKLKDMDSVPIKSILNTDFDVMLSPKDIMAAGKENSVIGQTLFEVVTLPNLPTGFVWLKLNQDVPEQTSFWLRLCKEFTFQNGNNHMFLSSMEVRNVFVVGMENIKRGERGSLVVLSSRRDVRNRDVVEFDVSPHGPAVTVTIQSNARNQLFGHCKNVLEPPLFYGDFIFAIRCIDWPKEAEKWPSRQRNWPNPEVIQEILKYGYHVVPKVSSLPTALEFEWRLSYSLGEIILSKHIPPVARACFLALKGTIKRHDFIEEIKGLSSYHLKTILFWALEKNPPDLWCNDRIEECFMALVDSMLECAMTGYCGHYFMPQMNLMATQTIDLEGIRNLLNDIKKDPVSVVSSTCLRCLSNLTACIECMCYDHGDDMYIDIY